MWEQTPGRLETFLAKWRTSFKKFMGFPPSLPHTILEMLMPDPNEFCKEANRRVREKMKNHLNNHNIIW